MKGNDSIFPLLGAANGFEYVWPGIDLRTWLAGQALSGLCGDLWGNTDGSSPAEAARLAIVHADALIAALASEPAGAPVGVVEGYEDADS